MELQMQIDDLAFRLQSQAKIHEQAMITLQEEARLARRSLELALQRQSQRTDDEVQVLTDDTFVRRVEWRVSNLSQTIKDKPRGEALWSPEFSILGASGLQLEFFPQGRDSTKHDGFCALFFWCPAGIRVKYQLRCGNVTSAPEEDRYESRMGHGHSSFCLLEAQREAETDSILVGVDIIAISLRESPTLELRPQEEIAILNEAPEAVVARECDVMRHRFMDEVQWRIKNIRARIREVPKGLALCSPLFSIAGVRQMLLEFYPNGIQPPTPDGGREGYCAFYLRCPTGNHLDLTLYVGSAQKGPITTLFDGSVAKGLPEFCKLADQLTDDSEDLIIGVKVNNIKMGSLDKAEALNI